MSSLVSEEYDFVIGVDTHATTHTFAVVAGSTGAVLSHAIFPTSPAGLERATGWLVRRYGDARTLNVIEGTGSFGVILTERLMATGHTVVEAARMPAGDRRGKVKSDELDAVRIARAVLGLAISDLPNPRIVGQHRAPPPQPRRRPPAESRAHDHRNRPHDNGTRDPRLRRPPSSRGPDD